MPRFFCAQSLDTGALVDLPAAAARHVQVLRMQPGQALTLFNGAGGEWDAVIAHMGRQEVRVVVGGHHPLDRESSQRVHLAVVMPANDRMDWLVEKATELGVDRITPLMSQRSVLRLQGERAEKKVAHWQAVAISACEQCGRNTVPKMDKLQTVPAWLAANPWQTGGKAIPPRLPQRTPPCCRCMRTRKVWRRGWPRVKAPPQHKMFPISPSLAPRTRQARLGHLGSFSMAPKGD